MKLVTAAILACVLVGCSSKSESKPKPEHKPKWAPAAAAGQAVGTLAPTRVDREGNTIIVTVPEQKPDLESTLAAYEAAPDEPNAVDGEKVARLGIQREPGHMYFIKDGDVWASASGEQPRKLSSTGVKENIKFLYYLDADGDLARRRK